MTEVTRRNFMAGVVTAVTAAKLGEKFNLEPNSSASPETILSESTALTIHPNSIDFRFAPRHWQTAICFPDDPKKSLVGQQGDLRYGFAKNLFVGMEDFSTVCTFAFAGMQNDQVQRQWLESLLRRGAGER